MPQSITNKEGLLSNPSALLSFYEIDGTNIGLSTVYRFFDGTNNLFQPITFNGVQYTPFPVKVEGLDLDGKGTLPRGKLTCSNINGFVSNLLLQYRQLNRAKFTRRRIYARFIDAVNFDGGINPFGTPDPTAAFEPEVFYVNRKISENNDVVVFELVTNLELDEVKLPNRPILANICPFRFRDPSTCSYSGEPVADRANKLFVGVTPGTYGFASIVDKGQWSAGTTYNAGDYVYIISVLPQTLGDRMYFVCNANSTLGSSMSPLNAPSRWLADACSKNLAGCKLHFSTGALPFGGFPGITRAPFNVTS